MNKEEILKYLKENPGWVLQKHSSLKGKGWWWLRHGSGSPSTIKLDGRSARAASAELEIKQKDKFGRVDYALPVNS